MTPKEAATIVEKEMQEPTLDQIRARARQLRIVSLSNKSLEAVYAWADSVASKDIFGRHMLASSYLGVCTALDATLQIDGSELSEREFKAVQRSIDALYDCRDLLGRQILHRLKPGELHERLRS